MIPQVSGRLRLIRERQGAKLIRYGAASAFNVVLGQALLYGAQTILDWSAVPANVFAVCVGTIPSYLVARYWVWQKRDRSHVFKEVVPFWILTLAGFALSTLAVWFVEATWAPHPIAINLTNLGAYGVVWVAKFFVLDRVLFSGEQLTDEPLDALIDEILDPQSRID